MPEFDVFNGGLDKLSSYINDLSKALKKANLEIIQDGLSFAEKAIVERSGVIDFEDERIAMQTMNKKQVFNQGKLCRGNIINVSDRSGYVEYGTGLRGANNPYPFGNPYPGQFMGYNVPSYAKKLDKTGTLYWFWKGLPTYGMPSYHIMYSSAREVEKELPNIVRKALERRFSK